MSEQSENLDALCRAFVQMVAEQDPGDKANSHRRLIEKARQLSDRFRETERPEGRLYDVNASCYALDGSSSDGAYDLHFRAASAREIADQLFLTLSDDWGLCEAGSDKPLPCRLEINIGPAGSSDNLPL